MSSSTLGGGEAYLEDGWRLGARITINPYRFCGHEVGYMYTRANMNYQGVSIGEAVHQGFYNFLVYVTPEGSKVRPFFTGGAQFSTFPFPGYSIQSGGSQTKFGVNYGGGIKTRLNEKWLIRIDYRQYASPKPDFFVTETTGWLRMNEVSVGFAFTM